MLHIIQQKRCYDYKRFHHPITNGEGVNYLTDLLKVHYNSAECEIFDRKSFDINIVKEKDLLFKEGQRFKKIFDIY